MLCILLFQYPWLEYSTWNRKLLGSTVHSTYE